MGARDGTRGIWAWPGPVYLYEWLLAAIICLPFLSLHGKSEFMWSVATALIVCATYISAAFRTDICTRDWRYFNHGTVWIMRAAALGVGFWLFSATPGNVGRFIAVIVYAVLYVISENMVWRRKRTIEIAV